MPSRDNYRKPSFRSVIENMNTKLIWDCTIDKKLYNNIQKSIEVLMVILIVFWPIYDYNKFFSI